MISCQIFRNTLEPGTRDAEVLEHLRHCDACLDFALQVDPDNFFRVLGGEEMVPPGGVDAFVGDVMTQVRGRQTETAVEPQRTDSRQQTRPGHGHLPDATIGQLDRDAILPPPPKHPNFLAK